MDAGRDSLASPPVLFRRRNRLIYIQCTPFIFLIVDTFYCFLLFSGLLQRKMCILGLVEEKQRFTNGGKKDQPNPFFFPLEEKKLQCNGGLICESEREQTQM